MLTTYRPTLGGGAAENEAACLTPGWTSRRLGVKVNTKDRDRNISTEGVWMYACNFRPICSEMTRIVFNENKITLLCI